jgi:hypothetical protein
VSLGSSSADNKMTLPCDARPSSQGQSLPRVTRHVCEYLALALVGKADKQAQLADGEAARPKPLYCPHLERRRAGACQAPCCRCLAWLCATGKAIEDSPRHQDFAHAAGTISSLRAPRSDADRLDSQSLSAPGSFNPATYRSAATVEAATR